MKTYKWSILVLASAMALALPGCGGKNGQTAAPIAVGNAPIELTQAFVASDPQVKEIADLAAAALQAGNHVEGSAFLSRLSKAPNLTPKQNEVVLRSMMGVNRLLREAAAKGDQKAADYIEKLR